jgi:DNA (cytosine-5)-methyltransferase 1
MERNLKVVSLFSGIGAYEKALSNLGIEYELEAYCELDPKTSKCYSAIHGIKESKNLVDVKSIEPSKLGDFDLLVYSPPCQDISTAGRHAGITSETRTGLMWNVVTLIEAKRPKYLVMENVKNLAGKYSAVLDEYVKVLEGLGYRCQHGVLNAKDYGTPQGRQRLFLVGVRDDLRRKFNMPAKRPLTRRLADYLTDLTVETIDREVAFTVRLGGRRSRVGNKHNWDGYMVNGREYYLTGKDCLLLMGFSKEDYDSMRDSGVPDGKIAKVAGNSVVVTVLEAILGELLLPNS